MKGPVLLSARFINAAPHHLIEESVRDFAVAVLRP